LKISFKFFAIFLAATPLFAAPPLPAGRQATKPRQIPAGRDFVRSLEIEGGAFTASKDKRGAQFGRVETRYLDPVVNAFVGMITTLSRFNEDLRLGDPNDPTLSSFVWNWGANVGIIRGAHTWALDLMGSSLGEHVAFGPVIVGEHRLGARWTFFHRTGIDMYVGDTILDSDQGIIWKVCGPLEITAGYRVFAMKHSNRNGPRASLILHFNVPKLPFIFPSIG
jgi:hypothetical protein